MKSLTSEYMRVPSREDAPRKARRVNGTKFPPGAQLGEGKKGRVNAGHGLLEENHIRGKGRNQKAEDFLFD